MSAIERWSVDRAARWIRRPVPGDDKYRRGVLGVRTGSAAYPGAAVLGVSAAWRAGVGMLRYVPPLEDPDAPFGLPAPAAAVLAARPETVFGEAGSRPCDAWVIGSGTDPGARSFAEGEALRRILAGDAPVVVDAGALRLAADTRSDRSAPLILTPHLGEFARLWDASGLGPLPGDWPGRGEPGDPGLLSDAAATLARRLGATVLLKGSTTLCATPEGGCVAAGPATPWLASAGTGDVLAGLLGALVCAHAGEVRADPERLGELGASAAVLHDLAARIAAGDPDARGAGRPITARDVAEAIPAAIERVPHRGSPRSAVKDVRHNGT